ncbi:hypothetical protein BGZ58_007312 [Dissophora ornata]|nr:hypothetical protein BGZ58_007312 [Dissophora ornata]
MTKEPLITAKVFLEDVVHLNDAPERLGLVVRTWHDFDSGENDSDDEDSNGPHVVVHWTDGSAPQTLREHDLVVTDRSFSHGDVVKRSPNDIMSGTVIDVKVELDLEKICPPMTRFSGIDAKHVDFMHQFVVSGHVIYDGWLGMIEEVKDEVTVMLIDGSVCIIKDSDDLDLRGQIHDQSCFFPDALAPGHDIYGPSRVFKNAHYINGTYTSERRGYVLRTEVTSITVNWLSFNPLALDQMPGVAPPPRVLDDFENIIVYKSVEQHCTFELQDRKVIGTKTRVTVQWQDLSITDNEESTSLVPYLNMDDQDVWPSDYVLLKPGEVLMDQPGGVNFDRKKSDMLGIVQSVNAEDRTTQVKWFSEERDLGLEQEAEEYSLYEIMSHPDLNFCMGDMVVVSREREQSASSDIAPRAPSVDDIHLLVGRGNEIFNELLQECSRGSKAAASTEAREPRAIERRATVLLERYGVEGVEALDRYLSEQNKLTSTTAYWLVDRGDPLRPPIPEDVLSNLPDHEKDLETVRTRLNWTGQIWKIYPDRPSALIRFMDGTSEEIPVGRIIVMEGEDDDHDDKEGEEDEDEDFEEYDFDHNDIEEVSSNDSWETDSEAEDEQLSDIDGEDVPSSDVDGEDVHKAKQDEDDDDLAHATAETPSNIVDGTDPSDSTDIQTSVPEPQIQDPLPEPEELGLNDQGSLLSSTRPAQERKHWKSFVVLEQTPADHHFMSQQHDIPQSDKGWIKRIAKEHAILSSSLPDGIRVRTFEDRVDLLRVLIQGPDHTPYRNALFLFDFKLTNQFPSQLLISLQGLVLVPEPYYNEAGFEKFVGTKEAARNSNLYNEKVYLLSLKTIQTILNNPPAPFEKEVRHFYFEQGKLEQTVIEGLELIARSEAAADTEDVEERAGDGFEEGKSAQAMKRISKGALKMLKKHIDTLSLSLEE